MLAPNPPASSPGREVSETPGSLFVGLRLSGAHVLVVGTGREAAARTFFALDAGANVTVVGPAGDGAALHPALAVRLRRGQIAVIPRRFEASDLGRRFLGAGVHSPEDVAAFDDGVANGGGSPHPQKRDDVENDDDDLEVCHPVDIVLSCVDDHDVSADIARRCRRMRIPVNCADIPDLCDFFFMAQFRAGGLQIGVSTGGGGPRLGARLRDAIVAGLDACVPDAVEGIATLRAAVREWDDARLEALRNNADMDAATAASIDSESTVASRMSWVSKLCDTWSYTQLARLAYDEALVDALVDAFAKRRSAPPSFDEAVARLAESVSPVKHAQPETQNGMATPTEPLTLPAPVVKFEQALSRLPMLGPFLAAFLMQWLMVFVFISGVFTRFTGLDSDASASFSSSTKSSQEEQVKEPAPTSSVTQVVIQAASAVATAASAAIGNSSSDDAKTQPESREIAATIQDPAPTHAKETPPGETAIAFVGDLSDRIVVVLCDLASRVESVLPREVTRWLRQAEMRAVMRRMVVRPKMSGGVLHVSKANSVVGSSSSGDDASATTSTAVSNYGGTRPMRDSSLGTFYIVGAGPGGLDTLTLAAVAVLQAADIVISDRLIPSSVLDLVAPERLVLNPVKTAGSSDGAQAVSNTTCMDALRAGKTVARLKTGDPFLFGRGGEEVLFFRERGIEPVVLTGVSSALGGPTAAMVPMTHRGVADSVLVVSGRGAGGAFPNLPVYDPQRTLVVLMTLKRLRELCDRLVRDCGYPCETRCVVLEKACWGADLGERAVFGRLSDMADRAEMSGIENPAMWVVGNIVGLLHQDRDPYFTKNRVAAVSSTTADASPMQGVSKSVAQNELDGKPALSTRTHVSLPSPTISIESTATGIQNNIATAAE